MPGSCSSGFKSRPSAAAGNKRSNGFEVSNKNRIKPTLTKPSTPITRATMAAGRCRLKTVTPTVHTLSISTHNNKEPSCEPQVAAIRYWIGSCEFELVATFNTEKSFWMKDHARQPKAIATKVNWPCAAGRAISIHTGLTRAAPKMGNTPCTTASNNARIKANCPISGIMIYCTTLFCAFCACSIARAASGGI